MSESILVSSITYAIKARDILRESGFRAYVARTPNNMERQGCGYSVVFEGSKERALEILRGARIRILEDKRER